ncbi:MAG: hypothetical protein R3E89_10975 [Thiolinea sp.]
MVWHLVHDWRYRAQLASLAELAKYGYCLAPTAGVESPAATTERGVFVVQPVQSLAAEAFDLDSYLILASLGAPVPVRVLNLQRLGAAGSDAVFAQGLLVAESLQARLL